MTNTAVVKKKSTGFWVRRVLLYAVLVIIGVVMVIPFLWMLSTSLKEQYDAVKIPPVWIPPVPQWDNYVKLFTEQPMLQFILNTLKIVFFVVIGQLFFSSLAAYSFARIPFKGRSVVFFFYIGTLMVPGQVTMIPTYLMFAKAGLTDNHLALILPAFFSAFGVFLLRQFFMSLPKELEEAAEIDGCGTVQTFLRVVLPLSKAMLSVILLYYAVARWNNYTSALYYLPMAPEKYPLQMVLRQLLVTMQETAIAESSELAAYYANLANQIKYAVIVIASLPLLVVYPFLQKYFEKGVMLGSVKG